MNTGSIHNLFPAIFPTLDLVAFERRKKGYFDLISEIPEWFSRLYPEILEFHDGLKLGDAFPFLDNFFFDADNLWQEHSSRKLQSGYWVETDDSNTEHYLQATAVAIQNRRLLFIESLTSEFVQIQTLMQRARENSLTIEKLSTEIASKDAIAFTLLSQISQPISTLENYFKLLEKENLSASGNDFLKICQEQISKLDTVVQKLIKKTVED